MVKKTDARSGAERAKLAMTDRQRKILTEAFTLLASAARLGKRKAETETASEVLEHIASVEEMLRELKSALEVHVGATAVLRRAAEAREAGKLSL